MWGGWLEFLEYVKAYKDIIVVGSLVVTGVSLFFVGRRLQTTMREVRDQYRQIELDFRSTIEIAARDLKHELESTLNEEVERFGEALTKKIDAAKQATLAAIEDAPRKLDVGAPLGEAVDVGGEPERWSELQAIWNKTKSDIEERLTDALTRVTNARQRRRYDNLNRSNYENIILQLFEDRWLGSKETDAALEMNNIFNAKKNRRSPVNHYHVSRFKELREQWEQNRDRRKKAAT